MKHYLLLILSLIPLALTAQVKLPKDANRLTYYQFDYGDSRDTSQLTVFRQGKRVEIVSRALEGRPVEGYAESRTIVDYGEDSITVFLLYPDGEAFFYRSGLKRDDIEWKEEKGKFVCSINSNRLEFEMDEKAGFDASPLPHYGLSKGVLRSFSRNGQLYLELAKAEKEKGLTISMPDLENATRVSPREMDRIKKERLVVTTKIFNDDTVYWGAKNTHFNGSLTDIPAGKTLHFAGGTIVAKRVRLPLLGEGYQHFVEIHQKSNGDAYDRTGSVFVIPIAPGASFFDGINSHPDSLPITVGRDGQRYQGIVATSEYRPPVEWVRFFTPFGVGKFNDKVQLNGIEWRNEAYYKQEITDIYEGGDYLVCAWIGNYSEGHLISVELRSYPNDQVLHEEAQREVVPLFNTCNSLEMTGQNYGKIFGTDTLRVTIRIPASAKSARLRYVTTGHGGWDEGDEFVPKTNTILLDGRPIYRYTPWRTDCACYRDLNPVSGNFWNGLSSSDYSRSGWCPGTATQPTFFDLSDYRDGLEHELGVAIPQGAPVEGMFSHWAVSGVLEIEY